MSLKKTPTLESLKSGKKKSFSSKTLNLFRNLFQIFFKVKQQFFFNINQSGICKKKKVIERKVNFYEILTICDHCYKSTGKY